MSKLGKTMVPELRFPEFVNDGEWVEKTLEDLCSKVASGNDRIEENGNYILYGSTGIIGKTNGCSHNGEVILVARVGANAGLLNKVSGKFGVTDNVLVVFLHSSENLDFVYYTLMKVGLNKLVFGSGQPLITGSQLKKLIFSLPFPKEQQKIADCLFSLDDVIAIQTEKLAGLKIHRKGLMQNLFPQEGENVPKLRFPGYSNDWKEKPLKDYCKFVRGPFGGALKKEIFVRYGYAVYEQSHAIYGDFNSFRYNISEERFNELKRFAVSNGDLIMSCSGTMGKFAKIPNQFENGIINQALLKISVKENENVDFIKLSLELPINQERLLSQSAGGAIKNVVSVNQIKELKMFLPELKEQFKIAECILSLDELISSQTKMIEQLKVHKKGLMQQLFPNIAE